MLFTCVCVCVDAVEQLQASDKPESCADEKGEGGGGGRRGDGGGGGEGGGGGVERDHSGASEDRQQVSEMSVSNEREHHSTENEEETLNDIKKQVFSGCVCVLCVMWASTIT